MLLLFVFKSLSHVWLCDPLDCSSLGSSVHEISHARILSGLTFLPLQDLSDPEREPTFPDWQVDSLSLTNAGDVVWSPGLEDPLEKDLAIHSSILAWDKSMDRGAWQATVHGVARVGHNLATQQQQLGLTTPVVMLQAHGWESHPGPLVIQLRSAVPAADHWPQDFLWCKRKNHTHLGEATVTWA